MHKRETVATPASRESRSACKEKEDRDANAMAVPSLNGAAPANAVQGGPPARGPGGVWGKSEARGAMARAGATDEKTSQEMKRPDIA